MMIDPPEATCQMVDTLASTLQLVETILQAKAARDRKLLTFTPFLYIDLGGLNLCRHGSVSILTVYIEPQNQVYLVDVHKLQAAAFAVQTPSGASLRSIFESSGITKVFFDVRNNSHALYSHYGVRLRGAEDIQLMENAARCAGDRLYLSGLARCITNDAPLSYTRKHRWERTKDEGLRLLHLDKGGAHEAFNKRPLDPVLIQYCANEVQYLPQLRDLYSGKLDADWMCNVRYETWNRVRSSQTKGYDPHAESNTLGPWLKEDRREALIKEEQEAALKEYFEAVMGD